MSILITEKTRVEAAIKKARELRPLVKIIAFGKFEVAGSKGETYHVEFNKQGLGLVGSCNCKAGLANKHACYHLAAAYPIFKQQVTERASARTCSNDCPNEAVSADNLCCDCLEASELSRIAQQRMAQAKENAYVESILGPELVAQLNYKPEAEKYLLDCTGCKGCFVSTDERAALCDECAQLAKDEEDLFGVAS